jgi:hypothetical protein
MQITLSMDDDTGVITILDQNGSPIVDESFLRKIRKQDSYKASVAKLSEEMKQKVDEEIQKFIEIHKLTPHVRSQAEWQILLQTKPLVYIIKSYPESEPTQDKIKIELWNRAKAEISSLFFWRNKGLREKFVNDNLDAIYSERHAAWETNKCEFDRKELETKQHEDQELLLQHNEQMVILERAISGDPGFINQSTEDVLQSISLPVEFSVDYAYDADKRRLNVDLDLPEIENLPIKKANITASGKLSIKEKSQKDLRYDYAQCVLGLAFFFAGQFFNISPTISEMVISGYTQRLSKKTGNIENEYIYSVQFDRNMFTKLNFERINPIDAFSNFPNRLLINQSFELKTIVPIE